MSDTTRNFQGAIEMSKQWSRIRFSESEAVALIAHCHAVLRSPSEHPDLTGSWNAFLEMQAKIKQRLDHTNWSKTEGTVLVLFSVASIEIRKGVRNFLPPSFPLSDADKEALWAWYLLLRGISSKPHEPYCFLYPSAMLFMGGAYAAKEIERRARKHPLGFSAGLIGYFWKSNEGKLPGTEAMVEAALKRIAGAARKKIPTKMQSNRDEGKTARGVSENRLGPIEEQVIETLLKDFFKGSGEEIMARSLDGLLNVVPLATARDIIDSGKTSQAGFEREVHFESDSDEIKFKIEEYPTEAESDEDILKFTARYLQRLEEFYLKYPEHREPLRARYGDGDLSQRELAKRDGVTDRAIRKRADKAEEDLKKWLGLSTKNSPSKSAKKN